VSVYLTWKVIIVVGALAFTGAGAIARAVWGPRARARKRLDAGTKTTIADREIVTLTGTVRAAGPLLESPLGGKPCVLYQSNGRVYEASTRRNHRTLIAEVVDQKLVAFDLETPEGTVRVEGEQADLELPPRPCIPRRIEREREFLLAHGQSAELIRFAGFDEIALEPGTRVRVQGMAIVELDPSAPTERGFRDDAPRRIRVVAHAEHPLTIGATRR
jgi:hypothetical protein